MPLTLTLTEGVLLAGSEKVAIARLTEAMLKWHGLSGNMVMTPNVTAQVQMLPKGSTFSGGKPFSGAWIEWKVPSFAFNSREIQKGFFSDATDIIHDLSGGKQPRDNIYVNVVHTVDGAWNLDGLAMTNKELGAAIAQG
ncbi:MAG: 4-oxalocrotonate tautomerase [Candidatus Thiodiazotropha sp. (ex Lucinoma borealis)]|nr:4-oxalocrotonate tautomerase [Candidatus Thiodiazotropha sp. (ex Lucinoma borealis)]